MDETDSIVIYDPSDVVRANCTDTVIHRACFVQYNKNKQEEGPWKCHHGDKIRTLDISSDKGIDMIQFYNCHILRFLFILSISAQ